MLKLLSFLAPNLLHQPHTQFLSSLACPRQHPEVKTASLSYKMVTTRSSKRKPEERTTSAPKRQTTAKQKVNSNRISKGKKESEVEKKSTVNPEKVPPSVKADGPSYYLFKSEPESRIQNGHEMKYSIDDLAAEADQTTHWDGVRNAEARNTMKAMKKGDLGFFYHSNTKKSRPGIIGIVKVVKEAYPDHTAFDKNDPHYDHKSSKDSPKWFMVDVRLVEKFSRCVTLDEVKKSEDLSQMQLVKRGRISVQRVTPDEWEIILKKAKEDPEPQAKS